MRVLHLNQSDLSGGAAIAAQRLHLGLEKIGVSSRMLVGHALSPGANVTGVPEMTALDRAALALTRSWSPNHINNLRGLRTAKHPWVAEADVVNLHNLHTGLYFNYLALPALARNKPLVWTLHDMWSFTGHCSYSYDCERWKAGCGRCPHPETYPAMSWDYSHLEWKMKRATYRNTPLTIVTPSRWLGRQVSQSMLGDRPLEVIPYGLDTDRYSPRDKREARRKLGIREDALVVMSICDDLSDRRKGNDLIVKMIAGLPERLRVRLLVLAVGNGGQAVREAFACECRVTGYVKDEDAKCDLYSSADVFVCASRADNLPLVLQESLACGTPMVAFDVGGVSDVVRHGETGMLSPAEDFADATHNLAHLLESPETLGAMSARCREIAVAEYHLETTAEKYRRLYESLTAERSSEAVAASR